jgi:hypothetical protein
VRYRVPGVETRDAAYEKGGRLSERGQRQLGPKKLKITDKTPESGPGMQMQMQPMCHPHFYPLNLTPPHLNVTSTTTTF